MGATAHYLSLVTLCMGVWLTPSLEDLFKVYVVAVVAVLTVLLELAFRFAWLRDRIVKHIVAAVLQEIMMDADMQKLMDVKGMQERILQKIRKDLEIKKTHEDQN